MFGIDVLQIVTGIISATGGSVLAIVGMAAYKAFKVKEKIQAGANGILELAGQSAGRKINMIKDKTVREQAYNDVRESADKMDDAFNKGLDETYRKE